jgi:hypothetical protein
VSAKRENFNVASITIAYGSPGAVHRIMERAERSRHDVEIRRRAQYEADYSHHEGQVPNPDR